MPRIANIATGTSRLLKTMLGAIRQQFWVLTVTIFGICAPVYAMAWWLNISGNLAANIALSILVSALPMIELASPPERSPTRGYVGWFSGFLLVALALFVGDNRDWRFLSFNAIFMSGVLTWSWIFWRIVRHDRILLPGFAFALTAMMIYWPAALVQNKLTFDLLLLPMPFILFAGVIWALIASWVLRFARRNKNDKIRGPASQVLAMATLFLPTTLIAFTIPLVFGLSDVWYAASLTIVSIVLGAVISEPLKNLFLEWGNLKPDNVPPK